MHWAVFSGAIACGIGSTVLAYRIVAWLHARDRRARRQRSGSQVYLAYSAVDKKLAQRLYERLTDLGVDVCLDTHRTDAAIEPCETFVQNLMTSQAFVPILSTAALQQLSSRADDGAEAPSASNDPFFLELRLALELHRAGRLRAIVPILREPAAVDAAATEDSDERCIDRLRECVRTVFAVCVRRGHLVREISLALKAVPLAREPIAAIEAAVQRHMQIHMQQQMSDPDFQAPHGVIQKLLACPTLVARRYGHGCAEAVKNVAELARLLGKRELSQHGKEDVQRGWVKRILCAYSGLCGRRNVGLFCCGPTLDLVQLIQSEDELGSDESALPRLFLGTMDLPGELSDKNLQVNPVARRRGDAGREAA